MRTRMFVLATIASRMTRPSPRPTRWLRSREQIRASADQGVPLNDADLPYKKNDALAESFAGKTNKVIAIQREIGKQPVLAFGNSSGDFAMLNYTLDDNRYPAAAFLVVADDTEREYGNEEKAADMRAEAAEAGWNTISMRDDWAAIYGEGVEKTHLVADEAADLANAA